MLVLYNVAQPSVYLLEGSTLLERIVEALAAAIVAALVYAVLHLLGAR